MHFIITFYSFLYLYKYYLFTMFVIFQVIMYSYECMYCYLSISFRNHLLFRYSPLSLSSTFTLIIIPIDHISSCFFKNPPVNFLRICSFARPRTIIIRCLRPFLNFFVHIWQEFDANL